MSLGPELATAIGLNTGLSPSFTPGGNGGSGGSYPCTGRNMGFDFGLSSTNACIKRKYRWLFTITGVSADSSPSGVNSLPPSKSARPNISFKETEAQHLSETIYFPMKPDWKPITLVLYDLVENMHPVFTWLQMIYDPSSAAQFMPSCQGFKKQKATLTLYDGCGGTIETWTFESVWPQTIEFGDLDMSSSEIVTCDLTLRYDRAYIVAG